MYGDRTGTRKAASKELQEMGVGHTQPVAGTGRQALQLRRVPCVCSVQHCWGPPEWARAGEMPTEADCFWNSRQQQILSLLHFDRQERFQKGTGLADFLSCVLGGTQPGDWDNNLAPPCRPLCDS